MGIPEHFGGLFFVGGLVLIIRTGACNLRVRADRIWFVALIGGFVFLASLYAVWIYASVNTPSMAEDGARVVASEWIRTISILAGCVVTVGRVLIGLI